MKKNGDVIVLVVFLILLIATAKYWSPLITVPIQNDLKKHEIELINKQRELDSLKQLK